MTATQQLRDNKTNAIFTKDQSPTQRARELNLQLEDSHSRDRMVATKFMGPGTEGHSRKYINVTINSVASSKKGSIFY